MLALAILWTTIQLLVLPLLLEQRTPELRLAFRNAWILLVRYTSHGMRLVLFVGLITLVSMVWLPLAWALISASASAYIANREVRFAIEKMESD